MDCSAFYPSVAEDYNFSAVGIPFLRVNEIVEGKIIFTDATAFLPGSIIKMNRDNIHIAHNKDILIAKGGNTAGKVGYLSEKYPEYATCRDVVILRTDSVVEINPLILATYLSSKYGKRLIERTISQTGQPHLTLPLLERLPIPLFSHNLQKKISNIENMIISLNHRSIQQYNVAESFLEDELGFSDWQPSKETVATKSFADFQKSGRLDAEYYQPKYDDLLGRLKHYDTCFLGGIVEIKKSIEPGSEAYQTEGIPFIRVADISKFGITSPEIHLDRETFYHDELLPKKDTILLSKDGSVGIAYKLETDLEAITSGALLHLSVKDEEFLPDYLTLVLNSLIVKMQAERDAGGSIIQHWKPSEIENVLIPKLPFPVQKAIVAKIQESFALRKESKRLLDLAKRAVEIAIEQDESAAIDFLTRG